MGAWFQDPPQIPEFADAHVSYLKWPRTVHTVDLLYPWIENSTVLDLWLIESIDGEPEKKEG